MSLDAIINELKNMKEKVDKLDDLINGDGKLVLKVDRTDQTVKRMDKLLWVVIIGVFIPLLLKLLKIAG